MRTPIAVVFALAAATAAAQPTEKVTWGFEAMSWWFQGSPTPVPVITNGASTNVLLGGGSVDTNPNPGLRVTLFYAPKLTYGIEANYLYVGERTQTNGVSSSGLPGSVNLLLPFYNVQNNHDDFVAISSNGQYAGNATTQLTNSMMGAELNVTWPIAAGKPFDLNWSGGFRWWRLKEKYEISTSSAFLGLGPADVLATTDIFDASNKFYGAQVGARGSWRQANWVVNGSVQVALGAMVQDVNVQGSTVTNRFANPGSPQTLSGGYFALPTNIGDYSRTVFAAVPELRLNVGYYFTPTISVSVGYDVLYASNVARPGNQVNRNLNPSQIPSLRGDPPIPVTGPAQPTFNFDGSSFWAQAVSATLHIRY